MDLLKCFFLFPLICRLNGNSAWTADWMSHLPDHVVKGVPLVQLALPGSHDSFSYNLSLSIAPTVARRYARSQDWNITQQLEGGIRYFDIRIYRDHDGTFRFYHGLVKGGLAVIPTLQLVYDYLAKHSGEFIILHFQHFDKITLQEHAVLIQSIVELFGDLAMPMIFYKNYIADVTLAGIRQQGHQVFLISFDKMTSQVDKSGTFFNGSALINPYHPTTKWQTMAKTLTMEFKNRSLASRKFPPKRFFVYQGVLTPTADYIIEHLWDSLKYLALPATDFITNSWMSNVTHNTNSRSVNIVMCDFVDHYNFPKTVALTNWKPANTLVIEQFIISSIRLLI